MYTCYDCDHFGTDCEGIIPPDEYRNKVEEYCKNLIRTVGKGGGFILTTSTGLTHEAKPENVRAMIESAKKYGRY